MEEQKCTEVSGGENLQWRNCLEDLGLLQNYIDYNLRFMVGGCEMDCSGSGLGYIAGCCEFGNEPSGSVKFREILDHLRKE
jgi:hypothetical protein